MTVGGQNQYNRMFETLVPSTDGQADVLRGMIAYSLYKRAKCEWVQDKKNNPASPGAGPTQAELEEYARTWTPSMVENLNKQAEATIEAFAAEIIKINTPDIEKAALRGKWSKDLWTGVISNGIFTLILIGLAFILAFSGINIFTIVESINSASP